MGLFPFRLHFPVNICETQIIRKVAGKAPVPQVLTVQGPSTPTLPGRWGAGREKGCCRRGGSKRGSQPPRWLGDFCLSVPTPMGGTSHTELGRVGSRKTLQSDVTPEAEAQKTPGFALPAPGSLSRGASCHVLRSLKPLYTGPQPSARSRRPGL